MDKNVVCFSKSFKYKLLHWSWTILKAEHQRIDAFELCCWRRFLKVSWAAKRSKQSILKEINPEYLLEGLMLKLKLQYFGHLMQRADSLEKTLMLGKTEGRRRRGRQRMRWLDSITNSKDTNLNKFQEIVKGKSTGSQRLNNNNNKNIACFSENFMYQLLYHP